MPAKGKKASAFALGAKTPMGKKAGAASPAAKTPTASDSSSDDGISSDDEEDTKSFAKQESNLRLQLLQEQIKTEQAKQAQAAAVLLPAPSKRGTVPVTTTSTPDSLPPPLPVVDYTNGATGVDNYYSVIRATLSNGGTVPVSAFKDPNLRTVAAFYGGLDAPLPADMQKHLTIQSEVTPFECVGAFHAYAGARVAVLRDRIENFVPGAEQDASDLKDHLVDHLDHLLSSLKLMERMVSMVNPLDNDSGQRAAVLYGRAMSLLGNAAQPAIGEPLDPEEFPFVRFQNMHALRDNLNDNKRTLEHKLEAVRAGAARRPRSSGGTKGKRSAAGSSASAAKKPRLVLQPRRARAVTANKYMNLPTIKSRLMTEGICFAFNNDKGCTDADCTFLHHCAGEACPAPDHLHSLYANKSCPTAVAKAFPP